MVFKRYRQAAKTFGWFYEGHKISRRTVFLWQNALIFTARV